MKLYGKKGHYQTNKILAAAAFADVKIELCEPPSDEKLAAMFPGAKLPLLEAKQGPLTQSNAIMRYIAELRPDSKLYGTTQFDAGQVDQVS
jgi:glutathione S-transferase